MLSNVSSPLVKQTEPRMATEETKPVTERSNYRPGSHPEKLNVLLKESTSACAQSQT